MAQGKNENWKARAHEEEERWRCIDGRKRTEKDVEVESVGEKQTVFLDGRRRSRAVS